MLVQTFYLFNSFSLLWNRRGAPRDHQCFFCFFFCFFFFFFWHRLSFLNTEALFCQIIRSSLNGAAFFPERAFTIQAGSDSQQKRNTLPFCLHSIWWEAASNTLKIKPWYPSFPTFTSWPIHWPSKLYLIKMHWNSFSCSLSLSLFLISTYSAPLTSTRVFVASFQIIAFLLQKVELKRMTRILGTIAFLIPLDSKATEWLIVHFQAWILFSCYL